jgi:hypothetical protein
MSWNESDKGERVQFDVNVGYGKVRHTGVIVDFVTLLGEEYAVVRLDGDGHVIGTLNVRLREMKPVVSDRERLRRLERDMQLVSAKIDKLLEEVAKRPRGTRLRA